jgi:hypothetical protein
MTSRRRLGIQETKGFLSVRVSRKSKDLRCKKGETVERRKV